MHDQAEGGDQSPGGELCDVKVGDSAEVPAALGDRLGDHEEGGVSSVTDGETLWR